MRTFCLECRLYHALHTDSEFEFVAAHDEQARRQLQAASPAVPMVPSVAASPAVPMVVLSTVGLAFQVWGGQVFISFDICTGRPICAKRQGRYWSGWVLDGWTFDGENFRIHVLATHYGWRYDDVHVLAINRARVRAFPFTQRQITNNMLWGPRDWIWI